MKETRCPFLETKTVTFLQGVPVEDDPVDRMSSSGGLCNSCNFEECSLYSEVRGGGMGMEHVRGFHLKSEYYYHPKHLWVARTTEERRGPGGDRRLFRPADRKDRPRVRCPRSAWR